jgi:hypothetical protein
MLQNVENDSSWTDFVASDLVSLEADGNFPSRRHEPHDLVRPPPPKFFGKRSP